MPTSHADDTHADDTHAVRRIIDAWKPFMDAVQDWHPLIESVEPKEGNCGLIYELPELGNEFYSVAIANMCQIAYAQPHFHANGEAEVYFVLEGGGQVALGYEVLRVQRGNVIGTPSGVAHYALPDPQYGLVLGVVNTPPFNPANAINLYESRVEAQFDQEQFQHLLHP